MKLLVAAITVVLAVLVAPAVASAGPTSISYRSLPSDGAAARVIATKRFDLIGLRWRGPGSVRFQVRGADGTWGAWLDGIVEGDDQPDFGAREDTSEGGWRLGNPTWVGPVDGLPDEGQGSGHGSSRGARPQPGADDPASGAHRRRCARRSCRGAPGGQTRRSGEGHPDYAPSDPLRDRPPHGGPERLLAVPGRGDHARHPDLPRQVERLERHRLQLPRRPLRHRLRGPLRRDRPERRRRPRARLQHRLGRRRRDRHLQHAARPRGRLAIAREAARLAARPRARRPRSRSRSISGGSERYLPGVPVTLRAVSGHRDTGPDDLPRRHALRPARRDRGQVAQRSGCRSSTSRPSPEASVGRCASGARLRRPPLEGRRGGRARDRARVRRRGEALRSTGRGTRRSSRDRGSAGGSTSPARRPRAGALGKPTGGPLAITAAAAEPATISPNGDGIADATTITYTLSGTATVSATLLDAAGASWPTSCPRCARPQARTRSRSTDSLSRTASTVSSSRRRTRVRRSPPPTSRSSITRTLGVTVAVARRLHAERRRERRRAPRDVRPLGSRHGSPARASRGQVGGDARQHDLRGRQADGRLGRHEADRPRSGRPVHGGDRGDRCDRHRRGRAAVRPRRKPAEAPALPEAARVSGSRRRRPCPCA